VLCQINSLLLSLLVMACARHTASDVIAEIARCNPKTIEIRVTNRSMVDTLLISPERPNRQVDAKRCSVLLSTKAEEWIRPYGFTPDLVALKAGETRTFTVELRESLPRNCREWQVELEYTYILAREARVALGRNSLDFRHFVMGHQRIVRRGS
jgi:hypothetical protein